MSRCTIVHPLYSRFVKRLAEEEEETRETEKERTSPGAVASQPVALAGTTAAGGGEGAVGARSDVVRRSGLMLIDKCWLYIKSKENGLNEALKKRSKENDRHGKASKFFT